MKKKNIIWIFSDQQPGYSLSCNGDPNVHTPNLDRMAGDGFNFRRAVSGFPLCCPFRGSLLTGLYPHECVPGHEYRMPPELPTAADFFNAAGYDTAYFGKWHLDGCRNKIDIDRTVFWNIPKERRGRFQTFLGYDNNNMQYDCYVHGHRRDEEVPRYRLPGYETDDLSDLLIDYLDSRRAPDQPFFAVLSVQPPHNPYIAPPENLRHYQPQSLKLRPNVAHNPTVESKVRLDLAGMYGMIENLDDNVGRILDCVRRNNLEEDTWIFYFSDHGDMHGSHGLFKKTNPYQESIGIPFVVWNGCCHHYTDHYVETENPYPLNHVDILPTSLGLAGLEVPAALPGFDYSPVMLRKPVVNPPRAAYLQNVAPTKHCDSFDRPYRGVLTLDNWKYVCSEESDIYLFDLNTDPYEEMNLAFNTRYRARRAELRQLTADFVAATRDNFQMPEFKD